MSRQLIPPTGLADAAFHQRAVIVTDLAMQVQDSDPAVVWDYLTCLSAVELQRMLMVALAAVRCDGRLEDIFGWVCELPAAVTA